MGCCFLGMGLLGWILADADAPGKCSWVEDSSCIQSSNLVTLDVLGQGSC